MQELTQKRLLEVMTYAPLTGLFYRNSNSKLAGCLDKSNGYQKIMVDGVIYRAHRLAWLYVYGAWPTDQIDHINGVREDNRISNLRNATALENSQNRKVHSNSKTGIAGVSLHKSTGLWRSAITSNGVKRSVGYFKDFEKAVTHYVEAKKLHHQFSPAVRASTLDINQ